MKKRKAKTCVWKNVESDYGDNTNESGCGITSSSEFTLEECEYKFCPWCGKRIKEEAAK